MEDYTDTTYTASCRVNGNKEETTFVVRGKTICNISGSSVPLRVLGVLTGRFSPNSPKEGTIRLGPDENNENFYLARYSPLPRDILEEEVLRSLSCPN